jgi:hypothetical protein
VLAVVGGALVALAPPAASGGDAAATIVKVVKGNAPPGATFTVGYSCTGVNGETGNVSFDENGNATGVNNFSQGNSATCTFAENATGQADNVAFTCETASSEVVCDAGGDSFVYTQASASTSPVTITVINAYSNVFDPLVVAPASGAKPGEVVTVSGTGCTKDLFGGSAGAGGAVEVSVGFPTPLVLNTTAAGTTGAWSVQFSVPANATGNYTIGAECGDPLPYVPVTLNVVGTTAAAPVAVIAAPTTTG